MSPTRKRLVEAVAPPLGYAYIRFLKVTMRLEYRDRSVLEQVARSHGQYILAFWHSRLVMMTYGYDGPLVTLSSKHRDSQMLARITRRFGVVQAWGSSTSGGAAGLRQILRYVRDGYNVAWTPDGPRGPRRRVNPGLISAARLSGKPIVPAAFSARPARRLGSWDRTLVPYPFGRGLYLYGVPLYVSRDADDETQEKQRAELEDELNRLTDLADRQVGLPVEEPPPAGDAP